MYKETAIIFGANLKSLRKALELTQRQISNRIGISLRAYVNYEQGKRLPAMNEFCKICENLNVKPTDFLNENFNVERKVIITIKE